MLSNEELEQYLGRVETMISKAEGKHDRGRLEEEALQILGRLEYDVDAATKVLGEYLEAYNASEDLRFKSWTIEERIAFDKGLASMGKDFVAIGRSLQTKALTDLVLRFYLLKHSKRLSVKGKKREKRTIKTDRKLPSSSLKDSSDTIEAETRHCECSGCKCIILILADHHNKIVACPHCNELLKSCPGCAHPLAIKKEYYNLALALSCPKCQQMITCR
jgi:hypothetical protein